MGPGERAASSLLALALAAAAPSPAVGADQAPTPPPPAPRVALALSGGGARGVAHVGALRALEEAGIPVDAIAANSMGAIVGSIYASGQDAKGLERVVRSMDWESLFSGRPDRRILPISRRVDRYRSLVGVNFDVKGGVKLPGGLIAEHRVNRFLIENLAPAGFAAGGDFERLPIAFRVVATDLATGDAVVLAKGDLARATRASMSIPLVFPPVPWEGKLLVDGLVVDNLPIDVARSFEPKVVVAIDIGSPPMEPQDYASALGVASQVNDLLTRRRYRDYAAKADVLVRPDLGKHSSTDYSGFDELIEKGYEATKAAIPEIRRALAAAGVSDLAPRARPPQGRPLEGAPIREVVIRGTEKASEPLVRSTFNVPVGPPFSMERGLRAFDKVDATHVVDRTWMAFEPAGDGVRVALVATDASTFRAEAGVGYSEWERARGSVRLRNNNLFGFAEEIEALLSGSDAEARAQVTLRGERLLVTGVGYRVSGYAVKDKPRYFDEDGDELNRALFERLGAEASLRAAPRRWIQIEAGYRVGSVDVKAQPGVDVPAGKDTVSALFGNAEYDTLDDLDWPEAGVRLAGHSEWSPAGLGGDREYWMAWADACYATALGRSLGVTLSGLVGLSGGDLAPYDWYRVGGPSLVPGYRHEELKGAQTIAGGFTFRYRLAGKLRLLARAGAGNVFESRSDVTLSGLRWGLAAGAMYPSPIGPVAVEVGVRDGGGTLVTLAVGWP
jgi:NTE family protein